MVLLCGGMNDAQPDAVTTLRGVRSHSREEVIDTRQGMVLPPQPPPAKLSEERSRRPTAEILLVDPEPEPVLTRKTVAVILAFFLATAWLVIMLLLATSFWPLPGWWPSF